MPVIGGLLFLIQIAFAVHVLQTGRDRYWVFIILMVPALGCAIYFITQVLPELQSNRAVRKAGNTLLKAIDPERELRRRKDELAISDNIDNRTRLADECLEAGILDEAIELYRSCLKGAYADEPHIMLKLAQAYFESGDFEQTRIALDALIKANPDFKSSVGHLLYARTLEGMELLAEAEKEYEVLLNTYPGEEARVRYALMLRNQGKTERAQELFDQSLLRARRAPKYYRRQEKHWLSIAKTHLA